jgi:hypothetical protein
MMRLAFKAGVWAAALSLLLAGCAPARVVGPVTYARCGLDEHTEAFPANPPKRAYGCRSNQRGFL